MSTKKTTTTADWLRGFSAIVVLMAITTTGATSAETGEGRSSRSARQTVHAGPVLPAKNESMDMYRPLRIEGGREKITQAVAASGSSVTPLALPLLFSDFWIYDADVILFSDDDGDGFFYGIDLLFDADTIYRSADVYAAVYLSLDGGPWNEYAVTEDFEIRGESANDDYVLVTELMSGYPTGNYDLLIELFDAYDGSFLAAFGPEDTSSLGILPLEDFNRDAPVVDRPLAISYGSGGGGAGGALLLLLFPALLKKLGGRYFSQARTCPHRSFMITP
jgi:hypothetical protein